MSCRICAVQIRLRERVLDHAGCTAPIRQHELIIQIIQIIRIIQIIQIIHIIQIIQIIQIIHIIQIIQIIQVIQIIQIRNRSALKDLYHEL